MESVNKWAMAARAVSCMRRLCHIGSTVLMSLAVLAATTLPPPVCHSHDARSTPSEGLEHERHNQAAGHSHSQHDHTHENSGDHHGTAADATDGSPAASSALEPPRSRHLHISLIGFSVSLFLPYESDSDSAETSGSDALLTLLLLDDGVILAPPVQLAGTPDVAPAADGVLLGAASFAAGLQTTCSHQSLLCDAAHCERPGVLLI
jgi:hypothetical protein